MHGIPQISRPCTPSTAAGIGDWFQLSGLGHGGHTSRRTAPGMTSWSCMIRAGRHHHHHTLLLQPAGLLRLHLTLFKRTQISCYYQADSYLLSIHLTVRVFLTIIPHFLCSVPMLLRRRDAGCKHWIQFFYWPIQYCEFICAVVVFICYFASYQENTVWWW